MLKPKRTVLPMPPPLTPPLILLKVFQPQMQPLQLERQTPPVMLGPPVQVQAPVVWREQQVKQVLLHPQPLEMLVWQVRQAPAVLVVLVAALASALAMVAAHHLPVVALLDQLTQMFG